MRNVSCVFLYDKPRETMHLVLFMKISYQSIRFLFISHKFVQCIECVSRKSDQYIYLLPIHVYHLFSMISVSYTFYDQLSCLVMTNISYVVYDQCITYFLLWFMIMTSVSSILFDQCIIYFLELVYHNVFFDLCILWLG